MTFAWHNDASSANHHRYYRTDTDPTILLAEIIVEGKNQCRVVRFKDGKRSNGQVLSSSLEGAKKIVEAASANPDVMRRG
ncbi:MAG: hypothetical protein WAM39_06005 [Bryobacteraceae bacterium]